MQKTADVIVIGAGAAGLAAASEVGASGLSVIILEARDRIGGRIFTQRDPVFQAPIEFGAEFIHGFPPEIWEPLQSQNVRIVEVEGEPWCFQHDRLSRCNFFSQVDKVLDKMDPTSPDESFLDFLKRCCPDAESSPEQREAMERALSYVVGFNAANPSRVGVHWLVESMRAEEKIQGSRAFRTAHGYEDLLDIFRQDLSRAVVVTQTGTIVQSVKWTSGHAEIATHGLSESSSFTAN